MPVAPRVSLRLTLLSRAYCHLCDEMQAVVAPLAAAYGAALEVIDVDAEPALDAQFGERVPVLLLGDTQTGCELAHYVCDAAQVESALRAAAAAVLPVAADSRAAAER